MTTRRRPADVSVHDWQHQIIAETAQAWRQAPKRSALDKHRRRELGKQAWWTLTGHVRSHHREHARGNAPFLGKTYPEIEAMHDQLHEENHG